VVETSSVAVVVKAGGFTPPRFTCRRSLIVCRNRTDSALSRIMSKTCLVLSAGTFIPFRTFKAMSSRGNGEPEYLDRNSRRIC
jgi:hypothetical protein